MTTDYVDISSNNGSPNLAAYRDAGHTGIMLKATEGTGYAWAAMPTLAAQWHGYGPQYRVGYYHWLYGNLGGQQQYMWFWGHIAGSFRPSTDLMMTDFEDVAPSRWVSDSAHLAVLREFDGQCDKHGEVLDYAPDWYIANLPLCIAYLKTRRVVASDYSHTPPLNRFGLNHVVHQFTDRAAVPGFPGPVDYNRWLTTESTDSGHAIPIPIPKPVVVPEEDIEMLIIRNGKRSEVALLTGNGAQPLQDGATVTALKAAGVKTAVLSERDYASLVRAGR